MEWHLIYAVSYTLHLFCNIFVNIGALIRQKEKNLIFLLPAASFPFGADVQWYYQEKRVRVNSIECLNTIPGAPKSGTAAS